MDKELKKHPKRCEHHGEELVLYCPQCCPSYTDLGIAYAPNVPSMQKRIAELEIINNNYRLGSAWTETEIQEIIDKNKRLDAALAQAIATYKKIEVTMSKYDTVYSIAIPAPEGEGMMDKELIRQQKRWLEICTRDMKAYPWQIWHSERAKLAKDTIAALEAAEQRIAELLNKYEPEPCSPHEWFDGSAVYEMGSRICRKCGVVQKARAKK